MLEKNIATYHLAVKAISRSAGRSSTAAAAYRAGEEITDQRSGEVHDYTRKTGVLHAEVVLPEGGTMDRADLWNSVETHHKRGDATLVREVEVSLPTELSPDERQSLAVGFARELADRYGVAADVALHAPRTITDRELEKAPNQYHETDDTGRRHNGNYHAHIMLSACHVSATGQLGKKSVEMDPIHCQRAKIENLADSQRSRWAELANAALERAGNVQRIDHRSHAERGIETLPSTHLGPAAAGYERRTGEPSAVRIRYEREAGERLANAKQAGDDERESRQLDRSILDLSGDLKAALAERDRRPTAEAMQAGVSNILAKFAARQLAAQQAAAELATQQAAAERTAKHAAEQIAAQDKARREQQEKAARAAYRKQDRGYSR